MASYTQQDVDDSEETSSSTRSSSKFLASKGIPLHDGVNVVMSGRKRDEAVKESVKDSHAQKSHDRIDNLDAAMWRKRSEGRTRRETLAQRM
ncbi:hypothetical protein GUITHDRAFT_121157 [Guillardia theta CCMP2712]|uniref:Uncharacterized protein n=1 Tax=Guillardia theta (strain CCMP2712) TaxID=905079 RepID=L1I9V2_GUITC|nr:hypothetical protein GUITHDRAFT_121157 [Guillardia theta CCMP2712]EKX32679.1 hypothetical protein GUITHDRAFT_121157 [Guillardia theta CCMP2712]|eukprot:XP_005819659.1 hypothetical protein GUITHDRAFT_121157 [Guillardia theta CCMP2712]